MTGQDEFKDTRDAAEWAEHPAAERLVVDLDGYAGPLDVLLELARSQKVDLTKISILQLADQYLAFIVELRRLKLEIAADYLVMAAWLAYLKSRLLLPAEGTDEDEPTGAEMAAALAFQLRRLEAMRQAGERLLALPQLRRDVFPRGAPEGFAVVNRTVHEVSLYDLLKAYANNRRRRVGQPLSIAPSNLYTVDDALKRLRQMLGRLPDWHTLNSFLPPGLRRGLSARSALASMFAASLELAKAGSAQLRQDAAFGPIYVRRRGDGPRPANGADANGGSG